MDYVLIFLLFFLALFEYCYLIFVILYDHNPGAGISPSSQFLTTSVNPPHPDLPDPIILEWIGFSWRSTFGKHKHKCPKNCTFTDDISLESNASIITYHMGNDSLQDLPTTSSSQRMNVFLSFEPPPHRPFYLNVPKDFFNLTATYRLDSDMPMPYDCLKELKPNDKDKWEESEVIDYWTFC